MKKILKYFGLGLASLALLVLGLGLYHGQAAGPVLFLDPASGSTQQNNNFTVTVRVNTQGQDSQSAQVYVTYPTDKLQFVGSPDYSGSPYDQGAPDSISAGTIGMVRYTFGTVNSGNAVFAKLTFKMLVSSGSAAINFRNDSIVANTSAQAIPGGSSGGTYTATAPPTPPQPGPGPQPPQPGPTPQPNPQPGGGGSTGSNRGGSGSGGSGGSSSSPDGSTSSETGSTGDSGLSSEDFGTTTEDSQQSVADTVVATATPSWFKRVPLAVWIAILVGIPLIGAGIFFGPRLLTKFRGEGPQNLGYDPNTPPVNPNDVISPFAETTQPTIPSSTETAPPDVDEVPQQAMPVVGQAQTPEVTPATPPQAEVPAAPASSADTAAPTQPIAPVTPELPPAAPVPPAQTAPDSNQATQTVNSNTTNTKGGV